MWQSLEAKATKLVPTAWRSAVSAGVGTRKVELDDTRGAPDATRKAVSHSSSAAPARRPAPTPKAGDRVPWRAVRRRAVTDSAPTTTRPTTVWMAGQMKLRARTPASNDGR